VDRTHGFSHLAPRLHHGLTTGYVSSRHRFIDREVGKPQFLHAGSAEPAPSRFNVYMPSFATWSLFTRGRSTVADYTPQRPSSLESDILTKMACRVCPSASVRCCYRCPFTHLPAYCGSCRGESFWAPSTQDHHHPLPHQHIPDDGVFVHVRL
jgi:hypothetical protein